jgi:galactofuranose transport system permease protein
MTNEKKPAINAKALPGFVWALAALALILLFNILFTPHFFRIEIKDGHLFGSLIDILNRGSPIMLLAIGMTLVIATKGIDISVGSVLAISGAIAAILMVKLHAPMILVFTVPILVSLVFGCWNGFLVSVVGIQPIIATLILIGTGRGIAQLITDGQIIVFQNKPFEALGTGFFLGFPLAISIVLVVYAAIGLLTRKTALGLFIESCGINPKASRYAGINARAILFGVYVISAFCAGISGLIVASDIKAADPNSAGLNYELDAILAVVIGGTSMDGGKFSLTGSVIGALVMQTLTTTILTYGVPVQYTLVVKALVVFAICLIQSESFRSLIGNSGRRRAAA